MVRKKILLASMLIFLFTIVSFSQEMNVDITNSKIGWLGKKITGQHNGFINLKSGVLKMDSGQLVGGSFVVEMSTIKNIDLEGGSKEKLEKHLNSSDFFDTENFPTSTLIITNVMVSDEDNTYEVKGDLTIKGITKPIDFLLEMENNVAKTKVVVDRSLYDIRYGSKSFFDNLGNRAIDNDFILDVMLQL